MPKRIEVPVPFSISSVNVWLFDGPRPALIDCGIGTAQGRETITKELGDRRELDLYLTHGHVDHAGNAAWLASRGAVLHAHPSEAPHVETFCRDTQSRNDRFRDALVRHGMPPATADAVRARSDEIDAYTQDTAIAAPLHDGDRIALGSIEATAIHAPGHTPGSMVYLTDEQELVSGDTLLEHITSNAIELLPEDEGRFAKYVDTVASMRRYIGCTILPGHHEPFVLTEEILERHTDRHARRAERIKQQLSSPSTAWDLLPSVFPRLRDEQLFLAMSEVVGHLHALELRGDALRVLDRESGVRRFVAA